MLVWNKFFRSPGSSKALDIIKEELPLPLSIKDSKLGSCRSSSFNLKRQTTMKKESMNRDESFKVKNFKLMPYI